MRVRVAVLPLKGTDVEGVSLKLAVGGRVKCHSRDLSVSIHRCCAIKALKMLLFGLFGLWILFCYLFILIRLCG